MRPFHLVQDLNPSTGDALVQARIDPWCVLLASREYTQRPAGARQEHSAALEAAPAMVARDPLAQTLRRAATVSPPGRIGAVVVEPASHRRLSAIKELPIDNIFVQPKHQGTAYEVLLALLQLESRVAPTTPIIFLPCDHVVSDEEVMTRSLVLICSNGSATRHNRFTCWALCRKDPTTSWATSFHGTRHRKCRRACTNLSKNRTCCRRAN